MLFTDKPSVRITRVTDSVLEDGAGVLTLNCISDANPPAKIKWLKDGDSSSVEYKAALEFRPVTRDKAGTYICQAENSVGSSDEERTDVDVLCR